LQRVGWGSLALLLLLNAGCALTSPFAAPGDGPKPGAACQVVTTWSNQVNYTPDPTHGGVPTPGLAGRLYLFDAAMVYPVLADGSLTVDLYNDAPDGPPGGVLLEEWRIDKDTLKRLFKKDIMGNGYTLFLPWASCRPDVTRVHLTVRYDPVGGGAPLWAQTALLTIEHPPAPAGPGPGLATAMAR
jgi:hypothetical protein